MAANKRYAGFSPDNMNIFRNMLGLLAAKWQEVEMDVEEDQQNRGAPNDAKHRTLSDFLGQNSGH